MVFYRCKDCGTYFYSNETYQDNDGEHCNNCLSQNWEEIMDEKLEQLYKGEIT